MKYRQLWWTLNPWQAQQQQNCGRYKSLQASPACLCHMHRADSLHVSRVPKEIMATKQYKIGLIMDKTKQ